MDLPGQAKVSILLDTVAFFMKSATSQKRRQKGSKMASILGSSWPVSSSIHLGFQKCKQLNAFLFRQPTNRQNRSNMVLCIQLYNYQKVRIPAQFLHFRFQNGICSGLGSRWPVSSSSWASRNAIIKGRFAAAADKPAKKEQHGPPIQYDNYKNARI